MKLSIDDPQWADKIHALIKPCSQHWALISPIKAGSLWVSKDSGRRCKVIWAMDLETTVEFSENHQARCTYLTERFLELYREA